MFLLCRKTKVFFFKYAYFTTYISNTAPNIFHFMQNYFSKQASCLIKLFETLVLK